MDVVHGNNIPDDAIAISEQQWHEYCYALSHNKQLVLTKGQTLELIEKPTPPTDYTRVAKQLLRATDYLKIDDEWQNLTKEQQQELNNYRASLRKINATSNNLPDKLSFISDK